MTHRVADSPLLAAERRRFRARPEGLLASLVLLVGLSSFLLADSAAARLTFRVLGLLAPLLLLLAPRHVRGAARVPLSLLAVVVWVVVGVAWSPDPGETQKAVVDLAALAGLGFGCGSVLGVAGVHRVFGRAWRLLLGACVVSLLVAPGYASRPAIDGAAGWHGVFGHKNALGTITVLALVTFWFEAPGPSRRRWLAITGVLLVGSRSSTALAVTIVLLGLVAWQAAVQSVENRWTRIALRAATALFVVAGATAFWVRIDIFASLLGRDPTLSGRTSIWAAVWRAIGLRPLLGQGLGGVWTGPIEPTATIWKEIHFQAFHAHSGYLDLLLQLGAIGGILFALFIGSTVVGLRRRAGQAGRWGLVLVLVLCLNAGSETGPFLSEGFVVLAVLSAAAAQKPPVRRRGYRVLGPPTPKLASSSA